MQVNDITVGALVDRYRSELDGVFGASEARAMVRAVFHGSFGWDAGELELQRTRVLSGPDLLKVQEPLSRLGRGEPFHYVMGYAWFMGMRLRVAPGVLIPRPETEELVDLVVRSAPRTGSIMDVGTGSGCIALALKRSFPGASVIGLDASMEALAIARLNGAEQRLEVDWRYEDVLVDPGPWPEDLSLVISNPPYVPLSEASTMEHHVVGYEPHLALFVPDADPLLFFRAIAGRAWASLVPGGELWFEGHARYAAGVGDLLQRSGFSSVRVLEDLSGNTRFIHGVR